MSPRKVLAQQKAKAENTQWELAILVKAVPPQIREGCQLLRARQEELQRVIEWVTVDHTLRQTDRQRIVQALTEEHTILSDQVAGLIAAQEIR